MNISFQTFSKPFFLIRRILRRIWFRAAIYGIIGISTAVLGLIAQDIVPDGGFLKIGANSVGDILTILASSMLAVATFSLSIMVTAFGNIANSATPRAAKLLMENQRAQRAVSTFIGAFLYSIVGITALTTGAYGEKGRFILFLGTAIVIVVIVVTLIQWVDQLASLGRVGDTIEQIEKATLETLKKISNQPFLGGNPIPTSFKKECPFYSEELGYIAYIDMEALQSICEEHDLAIALDILPGSFLYPRRPLGYASKLVDNETAKKLSSHFVIDTVRTFDQDPRFGFILLSEIASRALSPSVNDPGTAIQVLTATVRLFSNWTLFLQKPKQSKADYAKVYLPNLSEIEILGDVFGRVARDGAGFVEVGIKIQRALQALAKFDPKRYSEGSHFYSKFALELNDAKLPTSHEKSLVRDCAL